MSFSINNNTAAQSILSNLNNVNQALNSSYQQLSTGNRVNTAANDPAGYAISQQMTNQINGLNQATQNAQNGISMIQTATGAQNQIEQVLQTMSTLATEAANAGNTYSDRANLQLEMNALAQQINTTSSQTQYNGISLLTGQFGQSGSNLQLQIGANNNQTLSFNIGATDAQTLGVGQAQAAGVSSTGLTISAANYAGGSATGTGISVSTTDLASSITNSNLQAGSYQLQFNAGFAAGTSSTSGSLTGNVTVTLDNASGSPLGTLTLTAASFTNGGTFAINVSGSGAVTLTLASGTGIATIGSSNSAGSVTQTESFSVGNSYASGMYTASSTSTISGSLTSVSPAGDIALSVSTQNSTLAAGMGLQLIYSGQANASGAITTGTLQLEDSSGDKIGSAVTLTASQITQGGSITLGDQATNSILTVNLNAVSNLVSATGSGTFSQTDSFTLASGTSTQPTAANGFTIGSNVAALNILTQSDAQSAISKIQNAINSLSSQQAQLGAVQNRLNYTVSNLQNSSQNLQNADSTITNTDMAQAYTQFSQQQVLSQVGISMLSQAQQQPGMILKLLQ